MWRRPDGPPHVWKVIDLIDPSGQSRKFSLQEIPEDRYEEVMEHMCNHFIRDETMCASLDAMSEPESLDIFIKIWKIMLSQGISVVALEVTDNNEQPVLAGVNVLYYEDDGLEKELAAVERNSSKAQIIVDFAMETCSQVDPQVMHNVGCYLGGFGLSVDPKYRGMGLGRKMLMIRDEIGKVYGIEWTSTIFTGEFSQRAAASAGFETDLERSYEEAFDENGHRLFPNLDGKCSKVMSKRISKEVMWQRPSGPPHVWRVIDLIDANGKNRKFSMQEIPVDRYDEVLDHMCDCFVRDENLCASMNMKDDQESLNQLKNLWRKILNQGITVGAFEIIDNNGKSILAGVNILFYGNDESDKVFEIIGAKPSKAGKLVKICMDVCGNVDPRKLYNVNDYLGGFGLSVVPNYRGLGLANHLLKARDDIGKAYNIKYTSTIFSCPAAHKAAANAGFKVDHEFNFNEIKLKVMGKRIC